MPPSLRQSHPCPAPPYRAPWGAGAGRDRPLQIELSKEQEDEIQQALPEPGASMSSAPAAGHEPGMDSSKRLQATLVTRCPLRPMPPVKALRGTGAASRSGRR
jgi:hypothetical protein